ASRPMATRPEPSIPYSLPIMALESGVTTEFILLPREEREEGEPVAILEIKTADELFGEQELAARWTARRAARQTEVFRKILRGFLDGGGPIAVPEIVGASLDAATVHDALAALDDDDLIRIRDGQVDIAYPFSASATPFVVRLPGGEARYACCAVDALGIAPMAGIR